MISYNSNARLPCKQRGIAIVELAIALPVMIVMLLITAEITRVMYQHNTLTKLVRDGSRHMATVTFSGSGQLTASNEELQQAKQLIISGMPQGGTALLNGLTEDDISVTVDSIGTGGTQRYYVHVLASYDYTPIFASINGSAVLPINSQFDFNLTAQSSMRVQ